jgi:hypothetical protein
MRRAKRDIHRTVVVACVPPRGSSGWICHRELSVVRTLLGAITDGNLTGAALNADGLGGAMDTRTVLEGAKVVSPARAEAVRQVIVDDAGRLQERVDDRAADEAEAASLQLLADRVGQLRARGHLRHRLRRVDDRLAIDKGPQPV